MTKLAKTAAQRQELERERNRRARQLVVGLKAFACNAVDQERLSLLSRQDVLNAVYNAAKWAAEGQAFVDEARLISPPAIRAVTATRLDLFNIDLPFCRSCGHDLTEHPEGGWRSCKCKPVKSTPSKR